MSEAYFRVESGALGHEENFLSLDDILMSHEKLPVRTEIPIPRLGAFFPERSGGADTDNAIPQVSPAAPHSAEGLRLPVASQPSGAAAPRALASGICSFRGRGAYSSRSRRAALISHLTWATCTEIKFTLGRQAPSHTDFVFETTNSPVFSPTHHHHHALGLAPTEYFKIRVLITFALKQNNSFVSCKSM